MTYSIVFLCRATCSDLLWKAPELVRRPKPYKGSPKGDVYAFGIILYEIMGRSGPYGPCKLPPKGNTGNKIMFITCSMYHLQTFALSF